MLVSRDQRAEAVALIAAFCAAVASVVVFFPAEGRVLVPVHATIEFLLGRMSFVLPLGLGLAAALGFAQRARPEESLPWRRLVGLGLITIALLPGDALMGQSTGLVGGWFTEALVSVLGGPLTVLITVALLVIGSLLTFDLWRQSRATR